MKKKIDKNCYTIYTLIFFYKWHSFKGVTISMIKSSNKHQRRNPQRDKDEGVLLLLRDITDVNPLKTHHHQIHQSQPHAPIYCFPSLLNTNGIASTSLTVILLSQNTYTQIILSNKILSFSIC